MVNISIIIKESLPLISNYWTQKKNHSYADGNRWLFFFDILFLIIYLFVCFALFWFGLLFPVGNLDINHICSSTIV